MLAEAVYTIPDGEGGISLAIEPKYNIADNMNLGLRFESAAMAKILVLLKLLFHQVYPTQAHLIINFLRRSELLDMVEVKNPYLGISLGFYLDGGKWKKISLSFVM